MWPAIYNGQPFFSSDTPAYIRGADSAIHKAFGLSSEWSVARKSATSAPEASLAGAGFDEHRSLNSIEERFVLSGRSIYYGLLLYLGGAVGGYWFAVVIQGLLVSTGVLLTLGACRIDDWGRRTLAIATLCLTTAALFTSYLMPDIFAGLTILACAFVITFRSSDQRITGIFWFALLSYSLLAHSSHALLAIVVLVTGLLLRLAGQHWVQSGGLKIIGGALVVAFLGGLGFDHGVAHFVGTRPVRPPFLMARLIEDGPGYRYLRSSCPENGFVVCEFLDRLPVNADKFLWSPDPDIGVFAASDPETRRALSGEQYRFVWRVLHFEPWQQFAASVRNALRQAARIGAREFRYSEWDRQNFSRKIPEKDYVSMQRTVAYREEVPIASLAFINYSIAAASFAYLIYAFAFKRSALRMPDPSLAKFVGLIFLGLTANAAICGAMSSVHDRYQARVIWLLPLAALIVAFRLCDSQKMAQSQERS